MVFGYSRAILLLFCSLLAVSANTAIAGSWQYENSAVARVALRSLNQSVFKQPLAPQATDASAPLHFVENRGQVLDAAGKAHPEVLFVAKSNGATVYVTATSIHYVFDKVLYPGINRYNTKADRAEARLAGQLKPVVTTQRMTLSLKGANAAARVHTAEAANYHESYYLPHCPQGITARAYDRLIVEDVYPGVNWVIYSDGAGLKYDFELRQATLAHNITLEVSGADAQISESGGLDLIGKLGKVSEQAPVSFQEGKAIGTAFQQLGKNQFGFRLREVNSLAPITIDPSVVWSTYVGGAGLEYEETGIAVDVSSNVLLSGYTSSSSFPVQSGLQTAISGNTDMVVQKRNAVGTVLWSTYFGGSGDEYNYAASVNAAGEFVVCGQSNSTNFPVQSAFQSVSRGTWDAFVVKLSPTGRLQWSTLYGGTGGDTGWSCDISSTGRILVAGWTLSNDLNTTGGQLNYAGGRDAFVLYISNAGALIHAAYYGGSALDNAFGCAIDDQNNAYLVGSTTSTNFPRVAAAQNVNVGNTDAFFVKLSPTGSTLYSSYWGHDGLDVAEACDVDASGNLYVVGTTASPFFPTLLAQQPVNAGGSDGFITKVSPTGVVIWSTFRGGSGVDFLHDVHLDPTGNVLVAGMTNSTDLSTINPVQGALAGGEDASLAKLNPSGQLLFATYLGGTSTDIGLGCYALSETEVYLSGNTASTNFPVVNATQPARAGSADLFITRLNLFCPPAPVITSPFTNDRCAGDIITLNASSPGAKLLWSTGDTTASIRVSAPLSYTVTAIANGCSTTSAPFVLTNRPVLPTPAPNALACPYVGATISTSLPNPVLWYRNGFLIVGANVNSLIAAQPGRYVASKLNNGCLYDTTPGVHGVHMFPANAGPNDSVTIRVYTDVTFPRLGDVSGNANYRSLNGLLPVRLHAGVTLAGQPWQKVVNSVDSLVEPTTRFRNIAPGIWEKKIVPARYFNLLPNEVPTAINFVLNAGNVRYFNNRRDWYTGEGKDSLKQDMAVPLPLAGPYTVSRGMDINTFEANITAIGNTTLCSGDSVRLQAPAGFRYRWSNGDTTASITVRTAANYTLQTITGACTSATSTPVAVTVNPRPGPINLSRLADTLFFTSQSGWSYAWFRNGQLISGANSNRLTITSTGRYMVRVTNTFSCEDSASLDVLTSLSNKALAQDLFAAPNPTTSTITITRDKEEPSPYHLLSTLGQTVLSGTVRGKEHQLNLEAVPPGAYFLVVPGYKTVRVVRQ